MKESESERVGGRAPSQHIALCQGVVYKSCTCMYCIICVTASSLCGRSGWGGRKRFNLFPMLAPGPLRNSRLLYTSSNPPLTKSTIHPRVDADFETIKKSQILSLLEEQTNNILITPRSLQIIHIVRLSLMYCTSVI